MKGLYQTVFYVLILFFACSTSDDNIAFVEEEAEDDEVTIPQTYNILALGDSYTIGESVCDTCRFPEQLKDSLVSVFSTVDTFNLKVVAQTGWTTTNLINAIENENLTNNYDLVTLLIGVNNQYQSKPFSLYETEFPLLVSKAIQFAQNDKANVIVVSIPDYAFTPFGQNSGNPEITSSEIDMYNNFAENYCNQENITFVNITDITREGLINTDLVASDGLHPSELAYAKFVERLLPIAQIKIE
ncbi:SGNH/GDSL hydrolase family protein [Winogradskyella schleiferi]|uniref:SGNH/GDSL hydrolase family protein n=1 Tax=Winogradskyella schleiferi TaxID=2686078 RepID=UPI0015BB1680|nr:SGNH/GDSL hydrolase family protein [Winogradskyella schleiferi]